jgi:hypothetical protein
MTDVRNVAVISSVVDEQANVVVTCLVGVVVVELIDVSIISILRVCVSYSPRPKDESGH